MLLKVKSLKLLTGKPVAILHKKTAKMLAVYPGERVRIRNKHSLVAIVDTVKGLLKENEIALSSEVLEELNLFDGYAVDVSAEPPPKTSHYILEKLNGNHLDYNKLFAIAGDIVHNALTETEIAYFVSGVYVHGMSDKELADLTLAMVRSGRQLKLNDIVYDKHCIGGIAGNRTTPIIVSICSSAGITMPKTSSRAITSAAGTADVIECLAKVEFPIEEIKKIIAKTTGCMVWGGALGLAPADDKIIQVERVLSLDPEAQLIASILSKKIAVNAKGVVIDIPYGLSAKVKNLAEAKKLQSKFEKTAKFLKLNIQAVLTDGSQPIGNGVGPVLEMRDILAILRREKSRPLDLEKKSVFLSGLVLEMAGKAKKGYGEKMALEILESGRAFKKFKEIIEVQQGKIRELQPAKLSFSIKSDKSGKIVEIDNKKIASVARASGCPSDKASGIYLHVHLGTKVSKNQPIMEIYAETDDKLNFAKDVCKKLSPVKIK